jgi:hypothetical protein
VLDFKDVPSEKKANKTRTKSERKANKRRSGLTKCRRMTIYRKSYQQLWISYQQPLSPYN